MPELVNHFSENLPFYNALYSLSDSIDEIDSNSKSYFVRTTVGKHYNDFVDFGFIAVGHNQFTLPFLKAVMGSENYSKRKLVAELSTNFNGSKREIEYIASLLETFITDVSIGDLVIIPDGASYTFSVGVVSSLVYEETNLDKEDKCEYLKRINVDWKVKHIAREHLPIKLQNLFKYRKTLNLLKDEKKHLERLAFPIHKKGNILNLSLLVVNVERISADGFQEFIDDILSYSTLYGLDEMNVFRKKAFTESNINSEGVISFLVDLSTVIANTVDVSAKLYTAFFKIIYYLRKSHQDKEIKTFLPLESNLDNQLARIEPQERVQQRDQGLELAIAEKSKLMLRLADTGQYEQMQIVNREISDLVLRHNQRI